MKRVILSFLLALICIGAASASKDYFRIVNRRSGLVMTALKNKDYQVVQAVSDRKNENQLWELESCASKKLKKTGYFFRNVGSCRYLDVKEAKADAGVELIHWEFNGNDNQRFSLKSSYGAWNYIKSEMKAKCGDLYVDVKDTSYKSGAKLIVNTFRKTNYNSQLWDLVEA